MPASKTFRIGVETFADPDANGSQVVLPVPARKFRRRIVKDNGGQRKTSLGGLLKELRRRHALKVAVAYTSSGSVLLERDRSKRSYM